MKQLTNQELAERFAKLRAYFDGDVARTLAVDLAWGLLDGDKFDECLKSHREDMLFEAHLFSQKPKYGCPPTFEMFRDIYEFVYLRLLAHHSFKFIRSQWLPERPNTDTETVFEMLWEVYYGDKRVL
jgi:hypothetical protein